MYVNGQLRYKPPLSGSKSAFELVRPMGSAVQMLCAVVLAPGTERVADRVSLT